MSTSAVVTRAIDRITSVVPKFELSITDIISAQPLTELIAALRLPPSAQVRSLSEPSAGKFFIPARPIYTQEPLATLARALSLNISVRFYEVAGMPVYFIEEPPVDDRVVRLYVFFKGRIVESGVRPDKLIEMVKSEFEDSGIDPSTALSDPRVKAAVYYVWRDSFGYGPLEVVMEDPLVEEVSWYEHDGPVMVVDKMVSDVYPNAEFVTTNIMIPRNKDDFEKKRLLEQVVRLVASKARVGLSVAKPLAEARIPDPTGRGFHRLAAHLDLVSRSPGITIRKFPLVTYSLTAIMRTGELNELVAAYLVYHLLRRGFILIVGGMASGKTTLLQALISTLPTSYKIVTVEDTPELSTPANNWHPLYVRPAPKESELDNVDFDRLIRHSLRHRGTIVTLGEVRGAEMASLIQAAASGHGAICTFHASDPFSVLTRIMSPPINAAPESLKLISAIVHVALTKTFAGGTPRSVRRVLNVFEIKDIENRKPISTTVFSWDPMTDKHFPSIFEPDGSPANIPKVLAELWAKSPWLRTFGLNLYGDAEPERVLTDILALALFFYKSLNDGVIDTRSLLNNITAFYLEMDRVSQRYWDMMKNDILAEVKRRGVE